MICPNCKCEYIRGVTRMRRLRRCSGGRARFVRDPDPQDGQEIVSVWEGNDPGECAAVKEALEKAGIPFIDGAAGYFIFPSMRPKTEIFVSDKDQEQAKKIMFDLDAWSIDPDEMTEANSSRWRFRNRMSRKAMAKRACQPDSSDELGRGRSRRRSLDRREGRARGYFGGVPAGNWDRIAQTSEAGHWRLVVRPERNRAPRKSSAK